MSGAMERSILMMMMMNPSPSMMVLIVPFPHRWLNLLNPPTQQNLTWQTRSFCGLVFQGHTPQPILALNRDKSTVSRESTASRVLPPWCRRATRKAEIPRMSEQSCVLFRLSLQQGRPTVSSSQTAARERDTLVAVMEEVGGGGQ